MEETAATLARPGRGLLASDESTGTIGKRLEKAGLQNDETTRRDYRELFYTANCMGNYLSGAILFKETLYQNASSGKPFVDCLQEQGILPGIKVDEGLVPIAATDGETSTRGLDSLSTNSAAWRRQGARFAKWRAALRVGARLPSEHALSVNAQQLAQYAAICQANELVPIVEPELLIDGDHSIEKFADTSARVIAGCVAALWQQPGLSLDAVLLKPQMCIPGADFQGEQPSAQTVAEHTLHVMRRVVPPAIPGIMFLSGGQSEELATTNLQALNKLASIGRNSAPWALSFSFGRALQASVLKIWREDRQATEEAKVMAAALAAANSKATLGTYCGPHPSITSGGEQNLRENFRGWRTDVT